MVDKQADTFEGGLVPSVPVHEEDTAPPVPFVATATPAAAPALVAEGGEDIDAVRALIQEAMRARDAEVSALRAELDQVKASGQANASFGDDAGNGGFPWMYWKKPERWPDRVARGWVSIGPGGPTPNGNRDTGSYNRYLRKGMIPITRYGYIEPPRVPDASDPRLGSFLPILLKGGAKEFPASQVIALNWHIKPPVKGLVFPAYEAVKDSVINFVCEACGHTMFFMPGEESAAGENLRAHLMSAHKYPFREAAEAVKTSGLTITGYAGRVAVPTA